MTARKAAVKEVSPIISLTDNRLTTTSVNVSEVFHKQHKHVIRDIEQLKASCPESFNASNFGLVDYTDTKNEKRPMYILTRDGLTLLVMGYTGEKAMKFKLAYIEAFNAMEAKLKKDGEKGKPKAQKALPPPSESVETQTPASVVPAIQRPDVHHIESSIDDILIDVLKKLREANVLAAFTVNEGNCPIKGLRQSLYLSLRNNINSAVANVRAMAAAEDVRIPPLLLR